MDSIKGYIPVEGGKIYFEEAGSGQSIVLIHGFTLDTRMWDQQFLFLAKYFHVIRYDVRGFGKSSIPTDKYSHSKDCKSVLNYLNIESAHIIGLSMGGAIALDFTIFYPDYITSIILVDSSLGSIQPSNEAVSFKNKIILNNDNPVIHEIKKKWLKDGLFKSAFENEDVGRSIEEMVEDYSGYHWIYENPISFISSNYIQKISQIAVPTLVVVGERDIPKHQEIAELLNKKISDSYKAVIPKAGHMCNMENPEAFNKLILSFLRRF